MVVRPRPLPVVAERRVLTCQFILNDGRPWQFCNASVADVGQVYCPEHRAKCWVKRPAKEAKEKTP